LRSAFESLDDSSTVLLLTEALRNRAKKALNCNPAVSWHLFAISVANYFQIANHSCKRT